MTMKKGARSFGSIRKLPSGRYQARYTAPDGRYHNAPRTFEQESEASLWLSTKESELARGEWIAPEPGKVKFQEYAAVWMRDRILKQRTAELYDSLLANHLLPTFGDLAMSDIDPASVRRWRNERLQAGSSAGRPFGPVTVAKAYRLLHAIFMTASEEDRIMLRNPCRIRGAGSEPAAEREVVPLPVVFKLADAVPDRYRALILLAAFAGLRWGELAGLRRGDISLDTCEIRITQALVEPGRGGPRLDVPKSGAGKRDVAFPAEIAGEIAWHLDQFAEPGEQGLVFVGPKGAVLRRSNFTDSVWYPARDSVGLPQLHVHDLRHTAATMAAASGAPLKDLMARLGHSSPRAALIYQHASRDRDREIARAIGLYIRQARGTSQDGHSLK